MRGKEGQDNWLQDIALGIGTWAWGDRLFWGYEGQAAAGEWFPGGQQCLRNQD